MHGRFVIHKLIIQMTLVVLCFSGLYSCNDDVKWIGEESTPTEGISGLQYFPMKTGATWYFNAYKTDSSFISIEAQGIDTWSVADTLQSYWRTKENIFEVSERNFENDTQNSFYLANPYLGKLAFANTTQGPYANMFMSHSLDSSFQWVCDANVYTAACYYDFPLQIKHADTILEVYQLRLQYRNFSTNSRIEKNMYLAKNVGPVRETSTVINLNTMDTTHYLRILRNTVNND